MPYDEKLAGRLRAAIAGQGRFDEVRAFGGVMFMLEGKMCVGVEKDRLMVRVDPAKHDALLKRAGAGPMDFTGRPMRGFLFIGPRGTRDAKSLRFWVDESIAYVKTVPAKRRKRRGQARRGSQAPNRPARR